MIDSIEEFELLRSRRVAQIVGRISEVVSHQGERALEVLLAVSSLDAAAGLLKFPKLNYLGHR